MMVDAVELPGACKRQVMSVCPVTEEDYDEMVDAWKVDVQKPGVTCVSDQINRVVVMKGLMVDLPGLAPLGDKA